MLYCEKTCRRIVVTWLVIVKYNRVSRRKNRVQWEIIWLVIIIIWWIKSGGVIAFAVTPRFFPSFLEFRKTLPYICQLLVTLMITYHAFFFATVDHKATKKLYDVCIIIFISLPRLIIILDYLKKNSPASSAIANWLACSSGELFQVSSNAYHFSLFEGASNCWGVWLY